MEHTLIEDAIRAIPAPKRKRRVIARELRSHLEEARQDLLRSGLSAEEADRESLARLGDLTEIAEGFGHVYRPNRRTRLGLAFGLAGALLLGVYGTGTLASATSAHKATPHPHGVKRAPQSHVCHHPAA